MSKSLRSQMYRAARDLGNVDAVTKGYKRGGVLGAGEGTAKRIVRRRVLCQEQRCAQPDTSLYRARLMASQDQRSAEEPTR